MLKKKKKKQTPKRESDKEIKTPWTNGDEDVNHKLFQLTIEWIPLCAVQRLNVSTCLIYALLMDVHIYSSLKFEIGLSEKPAYLLFQEHTVEWNR